jgi:hypothetical protein
MMTCILPATQTVVTSWSNICHTLMEANADWWIPPEQQQRRVASVVDHDMNSSNHRDSQIESLPCKTSPTLTVTEFDETNDSTGVNHNHNYMVIMGKENMTRRRLNLTKVIGNVVVAAPPTLLGVATTTLACANSQHTRSLFNLPQQSMEEDEDYLIEEVDDFATATEDNDDDVGPRKKRYAAADDDSVSLF